MIRLTAIFVMALILAGGSARAQFYGIAPGSTYQGDYLRGVGLSSLGMGYFNLLTAEANSINLNTSIRIHIPRQCKTQLKR